MTLRRALGVPLTLGTTLVVAACNWISLAENALTYQTLRGGDAENLVVRDSLAYVARADSGLAIVSTRSGRALALIAPPAGSESVDDVALDGDVLFLLDARQPGHLSTVSLRDPLHPVVVERPREVPVGPFSGVSAARGLCAVSGGTSQLTAWNYDSAGMLNGPIARTDLGRGQPDVLVSRDGRTLFVSTHYWGPYFGLDVTQLQTGTPAFTSPAKLSIAGAGFTRGGAKPANFPIELAQLDDSTVLVAYARGVAVVDVARPASPHLLRVIDVGGRATNVDARDSTIAVSVAEPVPSVVLLALTRATTHVVRRITLPPGTIPVAVALAENHVIVAARNQGILAFAR